MTVTTSAPKRPAAQMRVPSANAPLVREAWYVVAARTEFDRTLRQRWILGEPVCFYEATDGTLVVLDDRCAHRRFPLSRSELDGDVIRCGYHGFEYGKDGRCVAVPVGRPDSIRVRAYPAVQRGPWVWIWTGADPDSADPSLIPWPSRETEGGHYISGYTSNPANYTLVHENLLDLTHLQYVHGIIDPEYTEMAPKMMPTDELPAQFAEQSVGWRKVLGDTRLNTFAAAAGEDPDTRIRRSEFCMSVTPALNWGAQQLLPHDPAASRLRAVTILHCLTPADETSTHQFWMYWQDVPFAMDPAVMAEFIAGIFEQDVEALGLQQHYVESDTRKGVVEDSVRTDAPGLRLRRMLHRLAAAEQR
ncbi:Rieske 2Fe-2S domain-containing protein [Mycobacterium avium]|uniref:Rieske 2Fe-2S domain-containing protein n=1 Tax=Mycobacterium avium TaxID=1764 RepID=UPI001CC4B12C|nr:Rieske 2Fe-2S domain-containing protein [Mycobacterium avium]